MPLPVPIVTEPAMVPLPPRVPPFTFTGPLPVGVEALVTSSAPAVTVVVPAYVPPPARVHVPLPSFVSQSPWTELSRLPEKVASRLLPPITSTRLIVAVPVPSKEPRWKTGPLLS